MAGVYELIDTPDAHDKTKIEVEIDYNSDEAFKLQAQRTS